MIAAAVLAAVTGCRKPDARELADSIASFVSSVGMLADAWKKGTITRVYARRSFTVLREEIEKSEKQFRQKSLPDSLAAMREASLSAIDAQLDSLSAHLDRNESAGTELLQRNLEEATLMLDAIETSLASQ